MNSRAWHGVYGQRLANFIQLEIWFTRVKVLPRNRRSRPNTATWHPGRAEIEAIINDLTMRSAAGSPPGSSQEQSAALATP